jgi:predicted ABC-type transport system involved in lysophospholipase L1 biosynthesis ATPase subunit
MWTTFWGAGHIRGVTLMMVTHSLQLIPFATRAFEMEEGNLIQINGNVVAA